MPISGLHTAAQVSVSSFIPDISLVASVLWYLRLVAYMLTLHSGPPHAPQHESCLEH